MLQECVHPLLEQSESVEGGMVVCGRVRPALNRFEEDCVPFQFSKKVVHVEMTLRIVNFGTDRSLYTKENTDTCKYGDCLLNGSRTRPKT